MTPRFALPRHRRLLPAILATLALATVTAAALPSAACAQTWPTKPIRILVPYAAGGASDTLTRTIGKRMGELLGQPIVVENKPGGASTLAIAEGAKAAPDGYTLTHVAVPFVITQFVYPNLKYDGRKDFVPIGLLQTAPLVLVVHPSLNVRTTAEFIAAAKREPGKITYAVSGQGSVTHMTGELFEMHTGADITPIPFKGGGQSITNLIGGQVDAAFLSPVEVNQHLASGRIIGIASSTLRRPASMPQLPTFAEAGVKDFDVTGWFGLVARAGTPPEVVAKLSDALQRALQTPEIRDFVAKTGDVPQGTVAEFSALLEREYPRWAAAVRQANVKPE